MPPYYSDDRVTVHHGDCLDVLRTLPDCSVDSVVTDPPAAISFMSKSWDDDKGGRDAWVAWLASVLAECRRILKPGGHALVWALPRTSGWTHRAIEDAGLDVRDCITHLFGSGFPKSLDVGKAIDRIRDWTLVEQLAGEIKRARAEASLSLADIGKVMQSATDGQYGTWYHRGGHMFFETGRSLPSRPEWEHLRTVLPIRPEFVGVYDQAEREVVGESVHSADRSAVGWLGAMDSPEGRRLVTAPATEDAARWDGWGTALKPSSEMWYLARRPLAGTVAQTVLTHGTGALNIAATKIRHASAADLAASQAKNQHAAHGNGARINNVLGDMSQNDRADYDGAAGRWPSNVVLTHGDCAEDGCAPGCPVAELDAQSGVSKSPKPYAPTSDASDRSMFGIGYVNHDREFGDSGGASRYFPTFRYQAKAPTRERPKVDGVAHPTVKPLALMRWLVRLVTPPGGVVLDPFGGSGATAEAAILEGFRCVTIEREAEYLPLILERIQRRQPPAEAKPTARQMSLLDDPAA